MPRMTGPTESLQPIDNAETLSDHQAAPGELGIWVFVLGDMVLFALLFGSYAYDYGKDQALFQRGQETLNALFGVTNTMLLLTGSLFVVLALHLARRGSMHKVPHLLGLAIFTGVAFFANKILEYSEKIGQGHTINSDIFFIYYYTLTGIHLLHVTVGIGVIAFIRQRIQREGYSLKNIQNLENGGAIWHMVDLLWIALFPLLYLI